MQRLVYVLAGAYLQPDPGARPPVGSELPDGGPVYTETNLRHLIKEPFNMVSAGLFLLVVGYWLYRAYPNYKRYWLVSVSAPILLVGAVGGMLYHGLRTSSLLYWLDFGPILGLAFLAAVYFWYQVLQNRWYVLVLIAPFIVLRMTIMRYVYDELNEPHLATNLDYSVLGLGLLIPLVMNLISTRARHVGWFTGALVSFVLALTFRAVDGWPEFTMVFPMGTHFLWHVFGALVTHALFGYAYNYERSRLGLSIRVGKKRQLLGIRVRIRKPFAKAQPTEP